MVSERAPRAKHHGHMEELHSQLRHTALVVRNGKPATVDVTTLVPGH